MQNLVRKAASLILCRSTKKEHSLFDFQVLMLQRKNNMASWGSMLVFPGGKYDHVRDVKLAETFQLASPSIATTLRECFEETGIFLPEKPVFETEKIRALSQLKLEYVAAHLSTEAHISLFFDKIAQICKPKSQLMPFIRLVTVPIIKNRFDASFFIEKLENFNFINFLKYAENEKFLHSGDEIEMCEEFQSFKWFSPLEILKGFVEKTIKLAPPQFIMLNIMCSFRKYAQLEYFLKECSFNQINMAANIVSMIPNKGHSKQQFPYGAALIGDCQFPYDKCIEYEKNKYLVEELKELKQKIPPSGTNRFLFPKPVQFFQESYSVECTVERSVLNKFVNSKELREYLNLYA